MDVMLLQDEKAGRRQTVTAKERTDTVERVYDVIRKVRPSKRAEQQVKQYLIPLLARKFPVVNELIRGIDYAVENELLEGERQSLIKQIAAMDKKRGDLLKEMEGLRSELAARTNHCKRHCRFSREQYTKEQKNFMDSLLEDLEDLELYVRVAEAVERSFSARPGGSAYGADLSGLEAVLRTPRSRSELRQLLKDFTGDICDQRGHRNEEKSNEEAGGPSPRTTVVIKALLTSAALGAAYKFLSTLDYCLHLNHRHADLSDRLSRFMRIVGNASFYTADLGKRIEEYGEILKIHVSEGTDGEACLVQH